MLCYQGKDLRLVGYSDADWGGDPDEIKLHVMPAPLLDFH